MGGGCTTGGFTSDFFTGLVPFGFAVGLVAFDDEVVVDSSFLIVVGVLICVVAKI